MKGEIPYILFLMKFFSNPKDFIFNLLFMRKNYKKSNFFTKRLRIYFQKYKTATNIDWIENWINKIKHFIQKNLYW